MTSNVFTKKQILQNLSSRGCYIDVYTLDAFFAKKKIEAIFEDSEGNEFYDNNALNLVIEGLFNNQANNPQEVQNQNVETNNNIQENKLQIDDTEAANILNNITLSDGTPLSDKLTNLQNVEVKENNIQTDTKQQTTANNYPKIEDEYDVLNKPSSAETQPSPAPLDDNMFSVKQESNNIQKDSAFDVAQDDLFSSNMNLNTDDNSGFDDITLLSESFEAQEKLRQYVMSELSKNNNMDMSSQKISSPSNNEFKLDISERTLNMIARTMAKKIAKYVGSIMAQDAKQLSKAAEFEEENKRLAQKTRELEEQNRKLRLLLAESNKNLNSYKPSIFGLYKKVDPNKNKK